MLIHKTYITQKERGQIIADMAKQGCTQVSTEGYFTLDKHLLFDDQRGKPIRPRNSSAEIDALEQRIAALENSI